MDPQRSSGHDDRDSPYRGQRDDRHHPPRRNRTRSRERDRDRMERSRVSRSRSPPSRRRHSLSPLPSANGPRFRWENMYHPAYDSTPSWEREQAPISRSWMRPPSWQARGGYQQGGHQQRPMYEHRESSNSGPPQRTPPTNAPSTGHHGEPARHVVSTPTDAPSDPSTPSRPSVPADPSSWQRAQQFNQRPGQPNPVQTTSSPHGAPSPSQSLQHLTSSTTTNQTPQSLRTIPSLTTPVQIETIIPIPQADPLTSPPDRNKVKSNMMYGTLTDPSFDNAPRVAALQRILHRIRVDEDYGVAVAEYVRKRPKALDLFEGFAKRVSEITERQTEEAQIKQQQLSEKEEQLAELNCLANVGDLVRLEIEPYADGLRSGGYEWSDWVLWWNRHLPYTDLITPPAQAVLNVIDSVHKQERGWITGGPRHQRLYRHVAGCVLFWSERCLKAHADNRPENMKHRERYKYLRACVENLKSGEYRISDNFVESAVLAVIRKQYGEYEDQGKGSITHKADTSNSETPIVNQTGSRDGGEDGRLSIDAEEDMGLFVFFYCVWLRFYSLLLFLGFPLLVLHCKISCDRDDRG